MKGNWKILIKTSIILHERICRAESQKDDAIRAVEELEYARELAEKAVAEGDGTLKKANFTYHTLSGFKNQVEESKQKAADALESVPSIKRQIENVIELIANSEAVSQTNINPITNP